MNKPMKIGSTKREIIRALDERSKTVSELSKELGLAKSSIYNHLVTLNIKGIVERITNGNKFVYYRLTERGKEILDVLLSFIVSSISAVAAYVFIHPQEFQAKMVKAGGSLPIPQPVVPKPYLIVVDSTHPTHMTSNLMATILAFIFVFIITFFSLKLFRLKKLTFNLFKPQA